MRLSPHVVESCDGCVRAFMGQMVMKVERLGRKELKPGAPGMTRTCDLLVRSQTLYPTELRARFS